MMPPTVTRSPSPRFGHLIDRVGRLRPELVLHPEQRMVGDELAEHLFLLGQQESLVELVSARTPSSISPSPAPSAPVPKSENCPAACALRSARIGAATFSHAACSPLCCTIPPRVYPKESNAPAKMSDSRTRFVNAPGSTRRQTSAKESKGPPDPRASRMALHDTLPDVADRREPVPDRSTIAGCRGEVHVGLVHVRGQDLDLHAPARVEVVRLAILVVLHRREDGRHVFDRVLRDQVRRLIGDEAVRTCVGGREPVIGEGLDQVEQIGGEPFRDPLIDAPATNRCRSCPTSSRFFFAMTLRSVSACPME